MGEARPSDFLIVLSVAQFGDDWVFADEDQFNPSCAGRGSMTDQREVGKFRKKPVEVEAIQWTGRNGADIDALVGRPFDAKYLAAVGYWIVINPDTGLSVMTPDEFEETYEPRLRKSR